MAAAAAAAAAAVVVAAAARQVLPCHTVSLLGARMVQQAERVGATEAATATAAPNAEATALLRARAAAALHFRLHFRSPPWPPVQTASSP
jgi:hypothetical protein